MWCCAIDMTLKSNHNYRQTLLISLVKQTTKGPLGSAAADRVTSSFLLNKLKGRKKVPYSNSLIPFETAAEDVDVLSYVCSIYCLLFYIWICPHTLSCVNKCLLMLCNCKSFIGTACGTSSVLKWMSSSNGGGSSSSSSSSSSSNINTILAFDLNSSALSRKSSQSVTLTIFTIHNTQVLQTHWDKHIAVAAIISICIIVVVVILILLFRLLISIRWVICWVASCLLVTCS